MAEAKMPEKLGRYEIVRELGKGAMGVVYEGKDPNIGRRVAIKTARREVVEASGMADEMMERFLREAQAAGALNHPNIITIYDAAEEEGIAYIAMEYLEGGDLGDLIDTKRRLSMEEIVEIGADICRALHVAHAHGVVHRDIKPANILMPTGKPIKVADFGIARVSDSNLTQDGALIGTPHYMSPEQFMGQKLDGRSDLFSVGNILYELTTGEKPFGGEALSTVMHHVIKTNPVNPTELNFNVPDALGQVIMSALSKRSGSRYSTGNAMAEALVESLKDNPDPAKLAPSPIAMEATIAGTAAGSPQATAIGGAPAGSATMPGGSPLVDATAPGGAPPNAESTIATPGPGDEATIPGNVSAPTATVPGSAPSPAATVAGSGPDAGATVPGAPPAPESTVANTISQTTPTGGNKNLLFGGIGAVAVIVIIAAVALSGGSPEGGGETNGNGKSGTPVAAQQNYYKSIQFDVWQAKDDETYRAHKQDNVPLEDLGVTFNEVKAIAVVIFDENNKEIVREATWDPTSLLTFPEDARPKALRYSIKADGIDKDGDIPLASRVGDSAVTPSILLPAPSTGS